MNAFIVDDEPLARKHLRRHLEILGVNVSAEAEDAESALALIFELKPDVLFLDIQMPGMTGLQLANSLNLLEKTPLVVYVTGYSEYALCAFEQNAVDYLVKPANPERLAKTVLRLTKLLLENRKLVQPPGLQKSGLETPLQKLPIRENFSIRFIPIEEISHSYSKDKKVYLITEKEQYKTSYTLTQLETLLPSERFFRIHESYIVQIKAISELHLLGSHSYMVRLTSGAQLPVSRLRYVELQKRLGLE